MRKLSRAAVLVTSAALAVSLTAFAPASSDDSSGPSKSLSQMQHAPKTKTLHSGKAIEKSKHSKTRTVKSVLKTFYQKTEGAAVGSLSIPAQNKAALLLTELYPDSKTDVKELIRKNPDLNIRELSEILSR